MRIFGLLIAMMPSAAHADLGHLGELAGHDHLLGLAALGLAGLAAALGLRGAKDDEDPEEETQEA